MLKAQESSYFRKKGKFWEPCKKSDKNRIEMNFSDIKSEELCPQPINFKQISELFEKSVRIDDSMELGKTIKFMNDNNKEFISGINQDPPEAKTNGMEFWQKFRISLGIGDSFCRNSKKLDKEEDVDSKMQLKTERMSKESLTSLKNSKYKDNAEINMKKSGKNGHVMKIKSKLNINHRNGSKTVKTSKTDSEIKLEKSGKKMHVRNRTKSNIKTKKVTNETASDSETSQLDAKMETKIKRVRKNSTKIKQQ